MSGLKVSFDVRTAEIRKFYWKVSVDKVFGILPTHRQHSKVEIIIHLGSWKQNRYDVKWLKETLDYTERSQSVHVINDEQFLL